DAASNRFASSLQRLGVRRGDRVFLRLPNRPEFYVASLAAAKLGAIFIPSSTQLLDAEVRYRLRDSEAVAAVTTAALVAPVEGARGDCPCLREVIVIRDPDTHASAELRDYDDMIAQGQENFPPSPTSHDDPAFIAYTSGTTGDPKGVVHLQRYPVAYE